MSPAPRPCPPAVLENRIPWLRTIAVVTGAVLISACGTPTEPKEEPDVEEGCESGSQRDCYDGPEGTFGVGPCTSGIQTCVDGKWGACVGSVTPGEEVCNGIDDNCDGTIDEGVTNACGGCGELEFIPGEACGECGLWECAGENELICTGDGKPPTDSCTADNGCEGEWSCDGNGFLSCHAVEVRNPCDVCGGPELDGVGEACETADGCQGVWACTGDGADLECVGPSKNNCGTCGAADVAGVGESCTAENGCEGTLQCDDSGTGAVCVTVLEKNECGLCGGPGLPDRGAACDENGCQGTWTCNAEGDALECDSPGRNNCSTCNEPDVPDLDVACIDDDGCAGFRICDAEGTGSICLPTHPLNECGQCAPKVSGLDEPCSDEFQCPGTTVCDGEGTGVVCSIDRPAGVGGPCFASNGCPGVTHCDGGGGVVCIADETCERPQHVVISQISLGRGGGTDPNNQFIELYNPTDDPYDLTQLEIWRGNANGSPEETHPDSHLPPALSNFICVKCAGDEANNCVGNERWTSGCVGKAIIQPRSYFLIGRKGYEGTPDPDAITEVSLEINTADPEQTGGQVWLFEGPPDYGNGAPVIDMVGYGPRSMWFEGSGPAPLHAIATPGPGPRPPLQSIARKAFANSTAESMAEGGSDHGFGNSVDTDDNASDFVILEVRKPRNSQSPPEPELPGD